MAVLGIHCGTGASLAAVYKSLKAEKGIEHGTYKLEMIKAERRVLVTKTEQNKQVQIVLQINMAKKKTENKGKGVKMELQASLQLKRKDNIQRMACNDQPKQGQHETHGSLLANRILHLHDQS